MLRDEHGHEILYRDDGFDCPVPEHEPDRVVNLDDASLVWERDGDE
ncbi:hypothetical protein ACKVMT_06995 [Halobacteriales archaeon Cl-PHB]